MKRCILRFAPAVLILLAPAAVWAREPVFVPHVIKPPRPGAEGNTVPSMVWLHDVNADRHVDLIASHVAWMNKPGFVHPYVAWYAGRNIAVAYLPDNDAIELNLSAFSAPVTARWFDPVRGRSFPVTSVVPNQGNRRFIPPAEGDWVLVIGQH